MDAITWDEIWPDMPKPIRMVMIDYTNYRGERSVRRIRIYPQSLHWGSNEWHPMPGWLFDAHDYEKRARRTFALASVHDWFAMPLRKDDSPPRETQASIGRWARETFPGGDDMAPVHALRLLDEAIELCRACGASWSQISSRVTDSELKAATKLGQDLYSRGYPDPAAVPGEAADVAITLAVLAERRGFDLQAEVDRKMDTNRNHRQWISRGDGTGRHRREGE